MQACIVLEGTFDRGEELVERGHLEALDETCRILHGLKLCSRYCVACTIASNIAEIAFDRPESRGG